MTKVLEYAGYSLMLLGAAAYLILDIGPNFQGLSIVSIFIGGIVALYRSQKIDLKNSKMVSILLSIIRIGGLAILCIALLSFGKDEDARTFFAASAIILVMIFLSQKMLEKFEEDKEI